MRFQQNQTHEGVDEEGGRDENGQKDGVHDHDARVVRQLQSLVAAGVAADRRLVHRSSGIASLGSAV